jgi:hypothetical protein
MGSTANLRDYNASVMGFSDTLARVSRNHQKYKALRAVGKTTKVLDLGDTRRGF